MRWFFLISCRFFASSFFILKPRHVNMALNAENVPENGSPCSENNSTIFTKTDGELENCEPYSECEYETYERLVEKDRKMRSMWTEYYSKSGEIFAEDVRNKVDDYPLLP